MYGRCDNFNHWKIFSAIQECITDGSKCNCAKSSILYLALFLIVDGIRGPLDQKTLENVPEPRWVCFKLSVIQSCSCFRHSTRSQIRGFLWNFELDSHANPHNAFGQLVWFSGKCVFVQKVLKRSSKTPSGRDHFLVKWLHKSIFDSFQFRQRSRSNFWGL